jgi:hypothetical protein
MVLLISAIGKALDSECRSSLMFFLLFNESPDMFEAEVRMERRSSFLPLVLMMCLAAALVGLAAYVLLQVRERTPLSAQQASGIVAATLQGSSPAGLVKPSTDVKPGDPNDR